MTARKTKSKEPEVKVREFAVRIAGPDNPRGPFRGSPTWSTGDIDFDEDGSLFIRNPYLANAIEEQLRQNAHNIARNPGTTHLVLFKLTRDEGWSGPKTNIVC
jgi:hypothetical protein